MKIFVLGANGMLGRYVYTYFKSQGFRVMSVNRGHVNAITMTEDQIGTKLRQMGLKENDIVINCIGLIKQRPNVTTIDFIKINSIFPLMLANICEKKNVRLIHPTTDCVYDGLDGSYNEKSPHNAMDIYGKSKSMGEPENATVIRTSIIGEELYNKLSFVEWVKSNEGKSVYGFVNHFWNGITCLEFCKVCKQIIEKNIYWNGVFHLSSPLAVTKYKMVEMVSDVYNLNVTIRPKETPAKCDRSITSYVTTGIEISDLQTQIEEMKEYTDILNSEL